MTPVDAMLVTAARDLSDAADLVDSHPWDVPFKVQQAAEKMVKAAILHAGRMPPRHHAIDRMVAECLEPDHPWAADFMALTRLGAAVTEYRYPSVFGDIALPPDRATLLADIDEVGRLLAAVARWCRPDFDLAAALAAWRARALGR